MDTLTNLFSTDFSTTLAGPQTALLAMLVCFCIGHIVAWVYMWTHDGLSYSKMFTMSLLAMPVIVALVMILMAGNIIIAVGLLAVFTVVRFRNVLKDTRDTTFVLWAIAEGVAIIAREPLANGFLTGKYTRDSIFPMGDIRHHWPSKYQTQIINQTDEFARLVVRTAQTVSRQLGCQAKWIAEPA